MYNYGIGETEVSKTCDSYDISQNKWSSFSAMKYARMYHGMVTYNNIVYTLGGTGQTWSGLCSVEKYDTVEQKWLPASPDLRTPMAYAYTAVSIDQHCPAFASTQTITTTTALPIVKSWYNCHKRNILNEQNLQTYQIAHSYILEDLLDLAYCTGMLQRQP